MSKPSPKPWRIERDVISATVSIVDATGRLVPQLTLLAAADRDVFHDEMLRIIEIAAKRRECINFDGLNRRAQRLLNDIAATPAKVGRTMAETSPRYTIENEVHLMRDGQPFGMILSEYAESVARKLNAHDQLVDAMCVCVDGEMHEWDSAEKVARGVLGLLHNLEPATPAAPPKT